MGERERILLLTTILILSTFIVTGAAISILYSTAIKEERTRLVETVKSQARLMEAVARFDAVYSTDYPEGSAAATLSQIIDAHERYQGFGETGEFTLARRTGDNIVFLLNHRHLDVTHPKPIPFDSKLAEPMRRALSGLSGSMVGLDYRGQRVLAAYEPVAELYLGIVAKIDLDEIRAPFVKAGLLSGGVAVMVIILGTILFFRITDPMLKRLVGSEERYRFMAEELLKSRAEWAQAMDFFEDAIYLIDMNDKVIRVNSAFYKLTGLTPEQTIGQDITSIIHPEGESVPCPVCVARRDRKDAYVTMEADHSGNPTGRPIEVMVRMIRNEAGAPIGVLMGIHDLLRQRQIEEELRKHRDHLKERVKERTRELEEETKKLEKSETALRYLLEDVNEARADLESANKKLRELDRLKSMFIASMSHELRTPLNSIIGFTGIILQGMVGEINDEQRDQLQRVYGSAKHLLALITDVIDISKIEAGKIEPYAEEFRLDVVIKEAVLSLKTEIDDKGLGLEMGIPQDLKLKTDRRRLLQCILNYLSNAVKFTEKGKISIAVEGVDGMVEIKVKDTGIGIKEENLPRLFNSFVRLDSPLKLTTPGTGLGLYLTKKLAAEVLGGTVAVESKYGEGSTFILKIPVSIAE